MAAIGIDLGTTYSCVGVWQHNRVEIIVNDQGNRTTPSCVAFTQHERLVGDSANNQINTNPANTVFGMSVSSDLITSLLSSSFFPITVGLTTDHEAELDCNGESTS